MVAIRFAGAGRHLRRANLESSLPGDNIKSQSLLRDS